MNSRGVLMRSSIASKPLHACLIWLLAAFSYAGGPSRLACELVLQMEFEETVGNEEHIKGVIATDIARACGGALFKTPHTIPSIHFAQPSTCTSVVRSQVGT